MRAAEIFVCSDWHLGHEKIAEFARRPPDFAELIFAHLRDSGIQEGDALLNLGDVYLYRDGEMQARIILEWLKARGVGRILCRGNHDSTRIARTLGMGWSWVCETTTIECYGKKFLFSHAPVEDPFEQDYNVHGHLHQLEGHRGGLIRDGKHILISAEMAEYHPIPLSTLAALGETPLRSSGKFIRGSNGKRDVDGSGDAEKSQKTGREPSAGDDGGDLRAGRLREAS